ncbi:transposase [Sphingomonas sp. Root710]|uniref:transposase n=1 Tax=Sphingomonas sp. Root710 TaxID=1736594 RepID=UPI000701F16F|nr:transposase [Sphingomonas sp. Root710]KRB85850.1 transposase [Sphingomonas sp. Root710]
MQIVIPSKINHTYRRRHDRHLYAARHLVGNFFAKLKAFRGISARYDKRGQIFLGTIHIASAVSMLN